MNRNDVVAHFSKRSVVRRESCFVHAMEFGFIQVCRCLDEINVEGALDLMLETATARLCWKRVIALRR
jgi:hypothetical protein